MAAQVPITAFFAIKYLPQAGQALPVLAPQLAAVVIGIGVVLYLVSISVSLLCRRRLGLKIFAGVPELSRAAFPGRLLQEGVYGVIRHPRYLSVIFGTVGWALFVNYLGTCLVVAVTLLGLWPLIVLEERELASRFGAAYVAYRARVPAVVPRFRRK